MSISANPYISGSYKEPFSIPSYWELPNIFVRFQWLRIGHDI